MIAKIKINALLVFVLSILIVSTFIVVAKPTETSNTKSMYILEDGNITDHVWSSDGTEIAYIKCPNGQLWGCELWVADWNLENNRLLYVGTAWSDLYDWKDEWILLGLNPTTTAQLTDGKATVRELWKIKDDGTDLTRITSTFDNGIRTQFWNHAYDNQGTAAWAKFIPETDLIYFSAHDGNGWWAAHTTTNDGSDNWKRLKLGTYSFTISMCPAGNKLLWGSSWYGWLGPTTLYSSNSDGSDVNIIKSYTEKKYPLCLADGNTIIVRSRDGHRMDAIDMDGINERSLLNDQYFSYMTDYHPINGQEFIMISDRNIDGNGHVYTMNSEGTGIMQLTEGPYDDYAALYSPNGGMIAYRRLPDNFDASSSQPYPYQLVVMDLTINKFENLIAEIYELVDLNVLNKGQGNSLIVKLLAAIKLYQKDHLHAVTNILNALINQVNAFIKGNKLSDTQGQILIEKALNLIEQINK